MKSIFNMGIKNWVQVNNMIFPKTDEQSCEQLTGKTALPLVAFNNDLKHTHTVSNLNLFD